MYDVYHLSLVKSCSVIIVSVMSSVDYIIVSMPYILSDVTVILIETVMTKNTVLSVFHFIHTAENSRTFTFRSTAPQYLDRKLTLLLLIIIIRIGMQ